MHPVPCALTPCLDETASEETVASRLRPPMAEATVLCLYHPGLSYFSAILLELQH